VWRRARVATQKGLVSVVIAVCLGAQSFAVLRASGARWYPFVDYPMYATSRPPGAIRRVHELWARTCDEPARTWQVEPPALGYQHDHFLGELGSIAADRPSALRYRTRLAALARTRLVPRPCALLLMERTISTTREGVDSDALRTPRRVPLREWPMDDPHAVRAFPTR
jgi:hypothetical protein